MKSRFVKLVLAVLSVFVFFGCSRNSQAGAASGSDFFSGEISGEISIMAFDSMSYRAFLEEAGRIFESRYPGVKVNIETFSSMPETRTAEQGNMRMTQMEMRNADPREKSDYLSRVNTGIMSGRGADIYAIDIIPLHKFVYSGNFENIRKYMEQDADFNRADYRQNILDALQFNDGVWFLPLDYTFKYFAFDSSLVPQNVSENFGTGRSFTTEELLRTGLDLYNGSYKIFNTQDFVPGPGGMFNQLLSENIRSFVNLDSGRADFANGNFSGLMEQVKSFGEEGIIPRGMTGQQNAGQAMRMTASAPEDRFFFKLNGNFSLFSQFSRGTGRMMRLMTTGTAQSIEDDDEIAGIQAIAGGNVPFGFNQAFAINAKSNNKAVSWAFIKFLLTEEIQLLTSMNVMGLPLNNKAREEKAELVFSGAFMGGMNSGLNDQQREALGNYIATEKILADRINVFVIEDSGLNDMIIQEAEMFFNGSRPAEETARILQNKADLYLSE